ncbi:hypothetical protein NC796_01860 [Aliifodinibius sp. S!AR15-10]|uniref:hypothetical protein n=1 Tax=Aliifodinibius sp. S!AR15-10 TaxID=2950437 RepID=UPI0028604650|nr:hypothetical protein [Aliifodinibius sp. S!AR15-10]MDR8389864.1 hypothetical protein [Aliifodinibius sp. S!AR15-10]
MQHIQHELSVGLPQRGLDLYCNIGLGGRHLYRMKCDSFVGQFIRDLYGHFTGGAYDALYNPDWNGRIYPRTVENISWDPAASMMKIHASSSLFDWEDSSEFAWDPGEDPVYALIWGCASVPALNGFWQIGQRSGTTDWWLSGLTTDISAGHLAGDGQVILK